MKMNIRRTIYGTGAAAAAAALAIGLGGCAAGAQMPDTLKVQSVDSGSNVVTVTGEEEVKVVPDMAQVQYSINSHEDTAAACQEKNSKDLAAAIETLKGLGLDEKSIQTSSYGLSPIYDWNSNNQAITGYEMTTTLTVSDIPIDDVGSILTQSVAAGINGIDSVNYFSSNYDASYQEALKGAMAMAQKKAEALAEAGGKTIAGVSHVEEMGYNPSVRINALNSLGSAKGATTETMAADMAVMPGQVSVEAQVTVDYEMN